MSDESGWVVPPSGVEIQVTVGPDAQMTPELRQALDQLVGALETEADTEVEGFKAEKPWGTCDPQNGPGGTICMPRIWFPCAMRNICRIATDP